MSIVNSPPSPQQLIVRRIKRKHLSGQIPGLLGTDEMNQTDGTLEMFIGRNILVICAWGTVIRKTQPVPIPKMQVQQSLVGAVEADALFG